MTNKKQSIVPKNAQKPIGPYSPAILIDNFLFISGQVGRIASGEFAGEDIESQTIQTLKNIETILQAANADISDIVKTTIYLKNINNFQLVNEIYGKWAKEPFPARSTIEVSQLPLNALIEIECIAAIPHK